MNDMLSGTTITRPHAGIASIVLTVAARVPYSAREHALRMLYTDMILSGAGAYTRHAWQDALGMLGSDISVGMGKGDIDFTILSADATLPKTLKLLKTLFVEPHFAESELVRSKLTLKNDLIRAKENARMHAERMFTQTFIADDDRRATYSVDTLIPEVAAVTVADLHAFHLSLWNFPWIYTSGGSAETNAVCERAVRALHAHRASVLTAGYQPHDVRVVRGVHVPLHAVPSKQNIEFNIGGALPLTRGMEEFAAFTFGMSVLGLPGGFAGRLMSTVREKEGLTYTIYGRTEGATTTETGMWIIGTFFAPKDAEKGIQSTLREINTIARDGITTDELNRFKTILNTRYALTEDSLIARIREAHTLQKLGVDAEGYRAFKDSIQGMTRRAVHDALAAHLNPAQMVIAGAGPVRDIAPTLKKLERKAN